jgi:hypothetical protein
MRKHECERVRALARDIVRGWRAAAEGDLVKVRACPRLRPPGERGARTSRERDMGGGKSRGRRREEAWRGVAGVEGQPAGVEARRHGRN